MSKVTPRRFLWSQRLRPEELHPQAKSGRLYRLYVRGDDVFTTGWVVPKYGQKLTDTLGGVWAAGGNREGSCIVAKNVELGFMVPFLCWRFSEWGAGFGETETDSERPGGGGRVGGNGAFQIVQEEAGSSNQTLSLGILHNEKVASYN